MPVGITKWHTAVSELDLPCGIQRDNASGNASISSQNAIEKQQSASPGDTILILGGWFP